MLSNIMNATYQTPVNLGDILGAHHDGNFQTIVGELKPDSGVLSRGSVLSAVALDAGKLTLTTAGSEAVAYGILLDPVIDTAASAAFTDGTVTASIARAGTFRGAALIVGVGTNVAALTSTLRDIGIFTEGAIVAPTAE
jgi:hypothetical protein